MDDLLRDFLTESAENLAKLDVDLVELEANPGDLSRVNGIFRTIHTIKGTCGFLGLARLESIAHAAENVLDAMRAGRLAVHPDVMNDVLSAVDCIKEILAHLEAHEAEPEGEDAALIACVNRWLPQSAESTADSPVIPVVTVAAPSPVAPATPSARLTPESVATPRPATAGCEGNTDKGAEDGTSESRGNVSDCTLRVSVSVLDRLMNLVGELALGRNQLIQIASAHEDSEFAKPVQQLNRVTTDLLEAVMKTRMQPIGNAWTKLPRVVRDLARASGKQIQLQMHGAETELDRQVLQAIQDPLTHMIRNSADHGIESPAARRAAGKPDAGTITLSARHEGGQVVIDITDDGAGINVAKVRRKAVERGLVKADVAETLPDAQVLRFIFEPGFSTADKVTNVSGRGVGMDVVRSNIESLGGTVELSSKEGRGATIRVKIPLTLAIISALLVGSAGETFAVPQIGVVELVRVTPENATNLTTVQGSRFLWLRDALLPLVDLDVCLGLPVAAERRDESAGHSIVVCQVGETRFGLVVDEVFDTQEIVVKPVGRLVKHLTAYAGCTITGDGRVIMILDPTGIAAMSHVANRTDSEDAAQAARADQAKGGDEETTSLLLFDAGFPALQAVPLSLVARLEEFPPSMLEEADGRCLVQYRGSLIPIVAANPGMDIRAKDPRPVLVFADGERTMGIAVDHIHDIVQERLDVQRTGSRPGILGVAVIAGRAAEIIDTDHFLRLAYGDWHARHRASSAAPRGRVLLVDDSRFFLGLLAPVLRAHGYAVATAMDGKEALARLEAGERFDLLCSDIDMAAVDGLTLARTVRANPKWSGLALVALTARASSEDRAQGLAAGFDRYLTKLDRDDVIASLDELLSAARLAA